MKILIVIPSYDIHGGIRIILEWANRLARWHDVTIYSMQRDNCNWFNISARVTIVKRDQLAGFDCLIITSPHGIDYATKPGAPKKVFLFMQMMEHLFNDKSDWQKKCARFYTSNFPMIAISKWNMDALKQDYNRASDTYYVGNGVNMLHFPILDIKKTGKTVLIEGWESGNPSKDPEHIGPKVAQRLRKEGYRILAYSQHPLTTLKHIPHEYYQRPDNRKMNELYERATILIKASRFDARSCSPMEAMTKGTVTARAIVEGDDDLKHGVNCLRCNYTADSLYTMAKQLLEDVELRSRLSSNCLQYVQKYSWDYWMPKINSILCQ